MVGLPWCPVVETPCSSHCMGQRFNPWSENQSPHVITKTLHSQIYIYMYIYLKKKKRIRWWEFPGSPVVGDSFSNAGSMGSIPCQGTRSYDMTQILHRQINKYILNKKRIRWWDFPGSPVIETPELPVEGTWSSIPGLGTKILKIAKKRNQGQRLIMVKIQSANSLS